ncbi:unnamed protein product [Callosobruchus maculatus]|uniref:Uncharacterized protein n=1 Tax=Callosobruchus maculatus TaxID=64391 RepID=A0A653DJH1_CALMS|nr:unnamed protein product [Callosobruchus maculatus]
MANGDTTQTLADQIKNHAQSPEKLDELVDKLIVLGYDVCLSVSRQMPLLMYTTKCNLKEATRRLLELLKDKRMNNNIFSKPVRLDTRVGNTIFDKKSLRRSKLKPIVNNRDPSGKAALNYAVENKYYDIACILLLHGASVGSINVEEQKLVLRYSVGQLFRGSVWMRHDLTPVIGLLALKVPEAVLHYSNEKYYSRLLAHFCNLGHIKVIQSLLNSIEDKKRKIDILNQPEFSRIVIQILNDNSEFNDDDCLQMIKYLFDEGMSPKADTERDLIYDILLYSADQGHTKTFKYFAPMGDKKHFNTYIGIATRYNRFDIIEYIRRNYREHTVDAQGNTALHYATWKGHFRSIKYLLENGDDVNINSVNHKGETPLDNAIEENRIDVIKYLMSDYNAQARLPQNQATYSNMRLLINMETHLLRMAAKSRDMLFLDHLVARDIDINQIVDGDMTLLHMAAIAGDDAFTKFLLQHGVIYDMTNKHNKTALDLSISHSQKTLMIVHRLFQANDLKKLIEELTIHRDSWDPFNPMIFLMNVKNRSGHTLLHRAVDLEDEDAVSLFFDYDESYRAFKEKPQTKLERFYVPIDTFAKDFQGNTLLHLAAQNGSTKIVEMLVNKNPSIINIENNRGYTPISVAKNNGHEQVAEFLFLREMKVKCSNLGK